MLEHYNPTFFRRSNIQPAFIDLSLEPNKKSAATFSGRAFFSLYKVEEFLTETAPVNNTVLVMKIERRAWRRSICCGARLQSCTRQGTGMLWKRYRYEGKSLRVMTKLSGTGLKYRFRSLSEVTELVGCGTRGLQKTVPAFG